MKVRSIFAACSAAPARSPQLGADLSRAWRSCLSLALLAGRLLSQSFCFDESAGRSVIGVAHPRGAVAVFLLLLPHHASPPPLFHSLSRCLAELPLGFGGRLRSCRGFLACPGGLPGRPLLRVKARVQRLGSETNLSLRSAFDGRVHYASPCLHENGVPTSTLRRGARRWRRQFSVLLADLAGKGGQKHGGAAQSGRAIGRALFVSGKAPSFSLR